MVSKYIKENANDVVGNLEYNSERKHLIIPEYGRHLQKLMSDFKLEVDSPYPIPSREVLQLKPDPINYPQNFPKYRFYGNNIKYMIDVANKWEEGEMKSALVKVIANHMKKSYLSWNKDTVKDDVIFEHLIELSEGKLNLLHSEEELVNTTDLMRTNKRMSNKIMSVAPPKNQNQNQNKKKPKPFQKNNNFKQNQ